MAAQLSTGTKVCCQCGKNLSGQQRMKDSEGKYWCIPCGEADRSKRRLMATRTVCGGCGDNFAEHELTELGSVVYCKKCLKKRYSKGGKYSSSMGGGSERRKKLMSVCFLVGVVGFGIYWNTRPKTYDDTPKPADTRTNKR